MSDLDLTPQYFDESGHYTAQDLRVVWQDVTNTGVVEKNDLLVVAKGGTASNPDAGGGARDMSVDVLPGVCWIRGDDITLQGSYHAELPPGSTDNITISANSSGSTRIDLIILQISDAPDNKGTILAVAGTPGSGAPDTPGDAILLALVSVPDSATSIHASGITDMRTRHQDSIYFDFLATDTRCPQSQRTDLCSVDLTLEKAQRIKLFAQAGFVADATSSATGRVKGCIEVDGDPITVNGHPIGGGDSTVTDAAPGNRSQWAFSAVIEIDAGDHTITLRGDRDGNGVINALGTQTFDGTDENITWLEVVV